MHRRLATAATVTAVALACTGSASAFDGPLTEHHIPTADSTPTAITQGPDGALWFTEATGNKIGRMTTSGTVVEHPLPTPGARPNGIVTGADGNLWFTETATDKIGRLNPTTGAITEFPIPTANAQPMGITLGPDGNVWFAEYGAGKLGRITPSGTITEFPTLFAQPPVESPLFVTAGRQGDAYGAGAIWYTSATTGHIGFLAPSGNPAGETTVPVPAGYASPPEPTGITIGSDGRVWWTVTDPASNSAAFESFGGLSDVPTQTPLQGGDAGDMGSNLLADDHGGFWYVYDIGITIALERYTAAGALTDYANPGIHGAADCFSASDERACPLSGAAFGPDGAVWFTDFSNDAIGRFPTQYAPVPTPATGPAGPPGPIGPRGANARTVIVVVPFRTVISRRSVQIRYAITGSARVTLAVRRLHVKHASLVTVSSANVKRGSRRLSWNRRLHGRAAPRGTYQLVLSARVGGKVVAKASETVRLR